MSDEAAWDEFEDLLVKQQDGVVVATMNQPDKLNALSAGMRISFRRLIAELPLRDDAKALVITGAGRGFCSGADLSAGAGPGYRQAETRAGKLEPNYAWLDRLRKLDIPVIAAINGAAAGAGMAIACASDLRVMDAGAKLHPGFVRRGLGPDNALSWTLPRLTGAARALLLLWTGDPISADEALRLGVVEQVAPEGQARDWGIALARRLAEGPSLSIALTKRAVYRAMDHSLISQGEYEQFAQEFLRTTADAAEGRLSFQEGRAARFRGE
ncbi:MAG: enoyl-CoA hydratase/isomerase family protein [Dehalococcoidia bacterium]